MITCIVVAAFAAPDAEPVAPGAGGPEMIPLDVYAAATAPVAADTSVVLPLKGGGEFALAGQGAPVLLTFWASWCGPCRNELPALSVWAKAHPEVKVLAVNVDRQQGPADKFLAAVKFDLPIAYDPDAKNLGHYGVTSMPTMFLFDRQTRLAWQHVGYSQEKGFAELDAALAEVR